MADSLPPLKKGQDQLSRTQLQARERKRRQRAKERSLGRLNLLITLPAAVHKKVAFLTLVHRKEETAAGLVANIIQPHVEADVGRYGTLFDEVSIHWREIKTYITKAVPLIRNPQLEMVMVYGVRYTRKRWDELAPIYSRIITRFRALGYSNDRELVRLLDKHFGQPSLPPK
jgi:hypothetical protein